MLVAVGVEYLYPVFFFFLEGHRGTRTAKRFVHLTGERKNYKMLEFPLNQLQTYYGYLCDLFSFMYIYCVYFLRFEL
jgi:hypothetical protein